MDGSTRRILTTHVGSLIRPPELVALHQARREGRAVDQKQFDRVLQQSVTRIIGQQVEAGIDYISDGEIGKNIGWARYVLERLAGFERRPTDEGMPLTVIGRDRRDFAEFYKEYDASNDTTGMRGWVVTGPIEYRGLADLRRQLAIYQTALKGLKPKGAFMPAVSPASVAPDRKDEYYKSKEKCLAAIAEALRIEYRAIVDAGFILQVDDSYLPSMYDVIVPPGKLRDYRRWAAAMVEVINHALQGIPEDKVRFHICWGSWNGPHTNDVPLRHLVDILLKIKAQAFSIEMANPRHEHEWQVFKEVKLPRNKLLLPGCISHATNIVEHPELVAERIVRLAKLVGRENVIASSDCGFAAQGPFVARTHPTIQWAKLNSLVQGARLATKALWPKPKRGITANRARSGESNAARASRPPKTRSRFT